MSAAAAAAAAAAVVVVPLESLPAKGQDGDEKIVSIRRSFVRQDLQSSVTGAIRAYADFGCIALPVPVPVSGPIPAVDDGIDRSSSSSFNVLTYKQVGILMQQLGAGLTCGSGSGSGSRSSRGGGGAGGGGGLLSSGPLLRGQGIGICANSCAGFYIADWMCASHGFVSIPMATTLDPETLLFLLDRSEVRVLLCDEHIVDIIRAQMNKTDDHPGGGKRKLSHLELIVVLPAATEVPTACAERNSVRYASVRNTNAYRGGGAPAAAREDGLPTIIPFGHVCWLGQQWLASGNARPLDQMGPVPGEQDFTVMFTSGSTGRPKGVCISVQAWHLRNNRNVPGSKYNLRWLSFQPPNHLLDRLAVWFIFLNGGIVGFSSGDLGKVWEQARSLQVTMMSAPARFWSAIHTEFQGRVATIRRTRKLKTDQAEQVVLADGFSNLLGDRIRVMRNSGSPISTALLKWLGTTFTGVKIRDTFGSTEAGGLSTGGRFPPHVQWKLVDVPHLSYFTSDQPHPRGEIVVKSSEMFTGYYRDPEATARAFTEDGFFRTGDIGMAVPDGVRKNGKPRPPRLVIVDRVKNIFKLAQGEFIAPEVIEATFNLSRLVRQVYVHADTLRSFVVAVAAPSEECPGNPAEAQQLILQDLVRLGSAAKMRPWEIPRAVLLASEPFSYANGQLTGPNKLCRPGIARAYSKRISQLYDSLTSAPSAEELAARLHHIRKNTKDPRIRTLEILKELIRAAIPGSEVWLGDEKSVPSSSLRFLGGDSLSMTRLASHIQEFCNVTIAVGDLLKDSTTVQSLADDILLLKNESTRPNSVSERKQQRAAQMTQRLQKAAQLDPSIGPRVSCSLHPALAPPNNVLVTGGTGFIGRHIIEQILRKFPDTNVWALVRADSDEKARDRLLASLATTSLACDPTHCPRAPHAAHTTKDLPQGALKRLHVMAGSLTRPHLGLPKVRFQELADNVDAILHSAAYVNHVMPFSEHEKHNVVGTIQVIQLACMGRPKRLLFLSSVGALTRDMRSPDDRVLESTPLGTRGLHHLDGYSQSKWVAERLIAQAGSRGLHVAIMRTAFVSGHSYLGTSNEKDMMSRLMRSIADLGLAPRVDKLWDMTPVDWAASVIVQVGCSAAKPSLLQGNFHLVSPKHAVPMSQLTAAVRACGHPVKEVSFKQWKAKVLASPGTPFAPLIARFGAGYMLRAHAMDTKRLQAAYHPIATQLQDCDMSPRALEAAVRFLEREQHINRASPVSRL